MTASSHGRVLSAQGSAGAVQILETAPTSLGRLRSFQPNTHEGSGPPATLPVLMGTSSMDEATPSPSAAFAVEPGLEPLAQVADVVADDLRDPTSLERVPAGTRDRIPLKAEDDDEPDHGDEHLPSLASEPASIPSSSLHLPSIVSSPSANTSSSPSLPTSWRASHLSPVPPVVVVITRPSVDLIREWDVDGALSRESEALAAAGGLVETSIDGRVVENQDGRDLRVEATGDVQADPDAADTDGESVYPVSEPPQYFDADKFGLNVFKTYAKKLRQFFLYPLYLWVPLAVVMYAFTPFAAGAKVPIYIVTTILLVTAIILTYVRYRYKVRRLNAVHASGLLGDTPMSEINTIVVENGVLSPAPLYDTDAMRWDDPLPYYPEQAAHEAADDENSTDHAQSLGGSPSLRSISLTSLSPSSRRGRPVSPSLSPPPLGATPNAESLLNPLQQSSSSVLTRTHSSASLASNQANAPRLSSSLPANISPIRSASSPSLPVNTNPLRSASTSSRTNASVGSPRRAVVRIGPRRSQTSLGALESLRDTVILPPNQIEYIEDQARRRESERQDRRRRAVRNLVGRGAVSARPDLGSDAGSDSQDDANARSTPNAGGGGSGRLRTVNAGLALSLPPVLDHTPRARARVPPTGSPSSGTSETTNVVAMRVPSTNLVDRILSWASGPVLIGEERLDEVRAEQARIEQVRAQMRDHFIL
ncbi:hypothetical protein HK101_005290, partial [Irineochytrium annulatum]